MLQRIRSGSGLGDNLYLQAIVRHLLKTTDWKIQVLTKWPEIYKPHLGKISLAAFSKKSGIEIIAHYASRKYTKGTTQFQDMCISARIEEPVDLRIDWHVQSPIALERVRKSANRKPILCVQMPRTPMGRDDGFGAELFPDCRVLETMLAKLREKYFVVQVGSGECLHKLNNIDLNLANKTSISNLLDVASIADRFIGQCSFMIPLAESFKRPSMTLFSIKGLESINPFVRAIAPEKVLHRPTSTYVVDNWDICRIMQKTEEFMD